MTRNTVQQIIQQKAEIAASVAASGAVVTWIDTANQFVDLAAGLVAIVAGVFTIIWYIRKFKEERKNGNSGKKRAESPDRDKA
jgi:flagellar biogenesis protein FliO